MPRVAIMDKSEKEANGQYAGDNAHDCYHPACLFPSVFVCHYSSTIIKLEFVLPASTSFILLYASPSYHELHASSSLGQ